MHNLKNVDIDIPRDSLVVFTGLSGSGKSSLAFDTIFAEGQRRYVESLSAYARQFLGQVDRPDVDFIEGLSPAVSIDQKSTNRNPRSTVGTITEIYDYMRLLWARIGVPHCPVCGEKIQRQTVQQIADQLMELPETHHLIGARELALMADGAGLVNTARSWLVDEAALLAELRRGRLSAAIDVFDEEPLSAESPFRSAPRVLLTPHRAAGTREGRLRQGRIVADELDAFAAGRPLVHAVDRAQLSSMA